MTSQTILLVDDDSDFLHVIGQRCRSIGLNVQHARNLLTATAVIDRFLPDVVCVDVEMPTGNGLRFCEALAVDPRTAQVPIIVLTGRKDTETIQKCEQMGAHYAFKSADIWATLEPLVHRLMPEAPPERPQTTTGVRQRKLPAHSIPPWPGESDAGNKFESDAGNSTVAGAGDTQNPAVRQVVIADDDSDLVQLLSERFSALGCSVIGVHTSLDAINIIHRAQPDLVVLDVNMPTGSGLCVCEMMATDERLRSVPVIILTGCSDERTIRRCHDMLVFYVQKGADVWSRIDPLVRELLHLGDAPLPKEPTTEEPMADERATDVGPQPTPVAAAGGEADSLLDAVFAMLGADGGATVGESDSRVAESREVVEMPWVLCIDDDFDFSDVLKIRFDHYGVAVARAANGMAGYRMAFSTPARAILLDYQMPNGQGDYVLNRLKDNPVTRDIPVIMITGIKDKMLERRVMAMGAAGYFLKPVDFESLRERLAEYIDALAQPAACLAAAER
ncbi:MAG: response regulator [Pirellulales bacterium]